MNRQQFGNFIAGNRKAAGLTQKELAARVHVTDKAVSKWERALSYPDVTLLEPLAEALGLGVEELMACRRREENIERIKEEEPVQNLLELSRESLRSERRRRARQTLLVLALMLAAVLGAVWYCSTYAAGQWKGTIVFKETVRNENYLYVEKEGHLLRLKCGEGVDFKGIDLQNGQGKKLAYLLDCRWNRRTYEGTVSACQFYGVFLGETPDGQHEVESSPLFWYDEVHYAGENDYPDPYGEPRGKVFLRDYRFWTGEWDRETFEWTNREDILLAEGCLNAAVEDIDRDGHNEVVVRTRWPEKPYMVYDWRGDYKVKEIEQYWLEDISPDLRERLMTDQERWSQLQKEMGRRP